MALHISLAAETIAHIGWFPVTNSLLMTWIVMAILLFLSLASTRKLSLIPNHLQSIMEIVLEGLYSFFSSVVGHHIKMIFPLVTSLFLFIILSNWSGLLPGVGTIGFTEPVVAEHVATEPIGSETHSEIASSHEAVVEEVTQEGAVLVKEEPVAAHATKFVPLLRGPTADLNMTIALALIAVIAMQYFGFKTLGAKYSHRFINIRNPILGFVGFLEIISDLSKVISFAFRLFGNIFAGEVLLAVMAFLMPFIAPMPFLMLELFVGFIQALVFSTLTSVFINVALAHDE
jgi:F-type H+-transporting ATPase subunit a